MTMMRAAHGRPRVPAGPRLALPALISLLATAAPTPPVHAPAAETVAVTHVTVVPMDRERRIRDQTVVVRDGRIVALGPAKSTPVPREAQHIDGRGRYLMPGLTDMHVHLFWSRDLVLFLANGVTTIRNMGGWGAADSILRLRTEVARGERAGPTIYTTGNWLDGDQPVREINTVVPTPEAARQIVRAQKLAGYDYIKVYARLSAPVYAQIMATAHQVGIPVTGHIPAAVGLDGVLAAGQVDIAHAAQVYLFGFPAGPDTARIAEVARQIREAGTAVTTTLIMMQRSAAMRGDSAYLRELLARPQARYLGQAERRFWVEDNPFLALPPSAAFQQGVEFTMGPLVRGLHQQGVDLMLGTDCGLWANPPGFSAIEELHDLVAAGLSPYQALRTATVNPAEFLTRTTGRSAGSGTVAIGEPANLLLLTADPLANVGNVARRAGVVVRGRWWSEAELQDSLRSR